MLEEYKYILPQRRGDAEESPRRLCVSAVIVLAVLTNRKRLKPISPQTIPIFPY